MAIKDYEDRKAGKPRVELKQKKEEHVHDHEGGCYCPYCDVELEGESEFCEACQSSLLEEH